jgi:nicotinic acid mononucleotide adenylyltransferase
MSSEPLQLHQFVARSILLFLIIGTTLLLAFAAGKDSLRDLSRWYISKEISTAPSDEIVPVESARHASRDHSSPSHSIAR